MSKRTFIFVKDPDRGKTGFDTIEAATAWRDQNKLADTEDIRVRVRLRSRTGKWDVVVKVKQEVKEQKPAGQQGT